MNYVEYIMYVWQCSREDALVIIANELYGTS
jgi:hypothetical protein